MTQKRGSSGPRPLNMACQLKEKKPKHTHTLPHTLTRRNKNPVFLNSTLNLQQTQIQNYFTMLPFLIQKMPILGVYIYFFSGLLLTYFKYISVTTCNRFLYLTAFPFISLHVTSSTYQKSRGAGRGGLFSVKLNAMVLNTGQKTFDRHFNTWK